MRSVLPPPYNRDVVDDDDVNIDVLDVDIIDDVSGEESSMMLTLDGSPLPAATAAAALAPALIS